LAVADSGYVARLNSGTMASTQSLERRPSWTREASTCTVEVAFVPLIQRLPTPWLFLLFRGFSTTLGRTQVVAYWLKNRLVRFLMRRPSALPLRLTRQVQLGIDAVSVIDEIVASGHAGVVECRRSQTVAAIHMGSSRYFQWQELDPRQEPDDDCAQALA